MQNLLINSNVSMINKSSPWRYKYWPSKEQSSTEKISTERKCVGSKSPLFFQFIHLLPFHWCQFPSPRLVLNTRQFEVRYNWSIHKQLPIGVSFLPLARLKHARQFEVRYRWFVHEQLQFWIWLNSFQSGPVVRNTKISFSFHVDLMIRLKPGLWFDVLLN